MLAPKNIIQHELIGLNLKVKESTSMFYKKISGKVIDETKNMLAVSHIGKKKYLPKNTSKFCFILSDGEQIEINGEKLVGRPHDRVKKILRRW